MAFAGSLMMLSKKESSYPMHTQDHEPSASAQPCLLEFINSAVQPRPQVLALRPFCR